MLLILFALAGITCGCSHAAPPMGSARDPERRVRVAAAADLEFALDDLVDEFGKANPGVKVDVTYGSSGNFYAQLTQHAPFDLFLSADVEYTRRLAESGLARKESLFVYAFGRLAVWVPAASRLDVKQHGLEILLDPSVRKVAIANPRHAPYGRAAEAALRGRGLYERVQPKLVSGENVAQAAQLVQSGAADAGIVALSLALAPAMQSKGRYAELPRSDYPRIEQGGAILAWAHAAEAAANLRTFILSTAGKMVLRRHGFHVPAR